MRGDAGAGGVLEAGRQAGAVRVVSGAYQRSGDLIRVTARLLDVAEGTVLRSATVTGLAADIFELQDRVAAELRGGAGPAGALRRRQHGRPWIRKWRRPTEPRLGSTLPRMVHPARGPFGRPESPRAGISRPPAADTETPPLRAEPRPGPAPIPAAASATGAAAATAPGAAGRPFAATAGLFVDAGLIDGPPAPVPPEVMTRDEEGRTTVRAIRLDDGIRLDGVLDEPVYETVPAITDFIQQVPDIGAPATERTEAWVMFDDTNVYVSARVWDSAPESQWVANEMRRDTSQLRQNDTFTAFFDTFYDRRNGFNFYTNPLGARADQQFTNEGNPNADWNPVWDVRTGRFDGGWTVEMEIPFKTLRYRSEPPHIWGLQLRRAIRRKNEWVYLTRLPISAGGGSGSAGIFRVSAAGSLVGIEPPPASRNIEVKPYAIGGLTTDLTASPQLVDERSGDAGLDVKYGITQNLTADFTYNTDFAQVEVDERQVNLTRFPLFFPEKREFFLEGRGIFGFARGGVTGRFGGPGGGPVGGIFGDVNVPQLFYSRKIGLEQGRVVPIVGGARVTGKIGQFDVGALNIQAGDETVSRSDPTNFTVVRLRRDLLRRSSVGAMFTNRSVSRVAPGSSQAYGIDGTFAFFENLSLITYVARTRVPGPDHRGKDTSYQGTFEYAADRYGLKVDHLLVEDNFLPEVGFLRRDNFRRSYVTGRFSPRPQSIESVRQFSLEGSIDYILTADENHLETRQNIVAFQTEFESSDQLTFTATDNYELLVRAVHAPRLRFRDTGGGLQLRRRPGFLLHRAAAADQRVGGGEAGRLLRRRPDDGAAQPGTYRGAAADVGGADRLVQLDRHAVRQVSDQPGGDAGELRVQPADVLQRPAAVQLGQQLLRQQPAPAVGVQPRQRAVRGLYRRPRRHRRVAARPGLGTAQPRLRRQVQPAVPLLTAASARRRSANEKFGADTAMSCRFCRLRRAGSARSHAQSPRFRRIASTDRERLRP